MNTSWFTVPILTLATLAQSDDDGLTLRELVESLPSDPTSIFAAVLVFGFLGLVLYFGTRSGDGGGGGGGEGTLREPEPRQRAHSPSRRTGDEGRAGGGRKGSASP